MKIRELAPERIVRLDTDAVVILDQRRLPDDEVELRLGSAAEVAEAIRTLAIRGAPAIGVAAAYGFALAAELGEDLDSAYDELVSARPTAVNLRWALDEMRVDPTRGRAVAIHEAEVARCRRMAAHAATLVAPGSRVLTHCNTGGLATGGYGTALGGIRAAWERGLVEHVWVDETRPLLQGERLTAWELHALGIPFSVLADAAAPALMSSGEVDCVLTGADRIASNGDTANKVGTYGLAVAARYHGIPLYVVAPTTTLDPAAATGADIPIELRDGAEVSQRFPARNPAFDVTPATLIAAIVTEEESTGLRTRGRSPSWCAHEGARPRRRIRHAALPANARPTESAARGRREAHARPCPRATRGDGGRRDDRRHEREVHPHFEEWASGRDGVRIVNDGTTSNDDRLGAIGDIGFVLDRTGLDDDLVVVAGDNLFAEDMSGFSAYGSEVDAPVLAVHDVGDLDRMREYNQVAVDDQGRITFFEEKPEDARSTLAGWPSTSTPADAAADPAVPGREEQPRPAGTPRRVALPAHVGLHLASAGGVVRHRLRRDPRGSRPHLFAEP